MKEITFFLWFVLGATVALVSCTEDKLLHDFPVYDNDFSELDLRYFKNGRLFPYNGDTVLGWYFNEEVEVTVKELPPHNYVKVSIDLLVHDNWDGNIDNGIDGPDYWYFNLDGEEVFRSTFSNSVCVSSYCLRQSFPDEYFRQHNPKTGAINTDLPGLCVNSGVPGWTTQYRITRTVAHFADSLHIAFGDELLQTNANNPKCDESWSVAKIKVNALGLIE